MLFAGIMFVIDLCADASARWRGMFWSPATRRVFSQGAQPAIAREKLSSQR